MTCKEKASARAYVRIHNRNPEYTKFSKYVYTCTYKLDENNPWRIGEKEIEIINKIRNKIKTRSVLIGNRLGKISSSLFPYKYIFMFRFSDVNITEFGIKKKKKRRMKRRTTPKTFNFIQMQIRCETVSLSNTHHAYTNWSTHRTEAEREREGNRQKKNSQNRLPFSFVCLLCCLIILIRLLLYASNVLYTQNWNVYCVLVSFSLVDYFFFLITFDNRAAKSNWEK